MEPNPVSNRSCNPCGAESEAATTAGIECNIDLGGSGCQQCISQQEAAGMTHDERMHHYVEGSKFGTADCCFGCCSMCNAMRDFETAQCQYVLENCRAGDLILFANSCSIGTCCIQCFTRSDFDHVGMIVHAASVARAVKPDGSKLDILIEGPHVLEAVAPHVVMDPLSTVIKSTLKSGGAIFWRRLNRPLMKGEPEKIPNTLTRKDESIPTRKQRWNSGPDAGKPGVNQLSGDEFYRPTRPFYHRKIDVKDKEKQKDKDGTEIEPIDDTFDIMDKSTEKYKRYLEKRTDVVWPTVEIESQTSSCLFVSDKKNEKSECMQLKEPLDWEEFNQEAINYVGVDYEKDMSAFVVSAAKQDQDLWGMCCPCCCAGSQSADLRSNDSKIESEDSMFCSELSAVMLYKAGWRMGTRTSDMYLPKDFSDDAHQLLSADMSPGCGYGPLIEIVDDTAPTPPAKTEQK